MSADLTEGEALLAQPVGFPAALLGHLSDLLAAPHPGLAAALGLLRHLPPQLLHWRDQVGHVLLLLGGDLEPLEYRLRLEPEAGIPLNPRPLDSLAPVEHAHALEDCRELGHGSWLVPSTHLHCQGDHLSLQPLRRLGDPACR